MHCHKIDKFVTVIKKVEGKGGEKPNNLYVCSVRSEDSTDQEEKSIDGSELSKSMQVLVCGQTKI